MKKRNVRVLTEKDMEGSQHKLSHMSEFDKLVEVCRVASELYDQHNPNNFRISDILSSDKSLGKRRTVTIHDDQETNKKALFSSRTCRISGEELLREGGRKKSKGETSSSSRYYEYANVRRSWGDYNHDDQLVTEKVLGKKRKCYDSKDEGFEYYDQVVKYKILGRERKCFDLEDEDSEYHSVKNKKKPRKINNKARNRVVAPLPVEVANEIQRLGGNDVRLLIQKNLFRTDLNPKENRFNIPIKQLREEAKDFLTEAEKLILDTRDADDKIVAMQVPLLEPNLNRSHIDLKKWKASTGFWYVLSDSWTVMHTRNHLKVHTDLQVWSFRVNGYLNLALVKVPPPRIAAVVSSPDQLEDGNKN